MPMKGRKQQKAVKVKDNNGKKIGRKKTARAASAREIDGRFRRK